MARISREPVERHDGLASLTPESVIVVRVASFTFRFKNVERLRECIEYYEKKTHPSSRIAAKTLANEIGESFVDGKWSGGLNACRCISWKGPGV